MRNLHIGTTLILAIILHAFTLSSFTQANEPVKITMSEGGTGGGITFSTELNVPGEYPTIQAAMAVAAYGDTIIVAPGIYEEAISMKAGVNLIGAGLDQTTIQTSEDAVIHGASNSTVSGFTLDGIKWGIAYDNMSNFRVLDNRIILTEESHGGDTLIGIYIQNSSEFVIYGNDIGPIVEELWGYAAGVVIKNSSDAIVINNIIRNVSDRDWGQALGMWLHNSDRIKILKNLIYRVSGRDWDDVLGIYNRGSSNLILNNVIAEPTGEYATGAVYGIFNVGTDNKISNNIIDELRSNAFNYNAAGFGMYDVGTDNDISYNDVWNTWGPFVPYYGEVEPIDTPDSGNLNVAPLFEGFGWTRNKYILQPNSPCIDAGDPGEAYNDFHGTYSTRNDMGIFGGKYIIDGPTNIEGDVRGQVWTKLGSPYVIKGNLTVPVHTTLTIEEGVEVRFDGDYGLNVYGSLNAKGIAPEPILFTCNEPMPNVAGWGGIEFIGFGGGSSSELEHVIIEYATTGLDYQRGTRQHSLKHSLVRNNYTGIHLGYTNNINDAPAPEIINNTITENLAGLIIHSEDSSGPIKNNIIHGNDYVDLGLGLGGLDPNLSYNDVGTTNAPSSVLGSGAISDNPLFVDPLNGNYHLQSASLCVDAGDPGSPSDPDGTRADMGAFYYYQSSVRSISDNPDPNPVHPSESRSEAVQLRPGLWQNYPNPFALGTNISFYLPESNVVYLEVFDGKGRLLAVLMDGIRRDPGMHTVPWDGRDSHGTGVSSGVYFYRFRAGEFVETRKMILAQ